MNEIQKYVLYIKKFMVNNIARSWISRCENICYKQITKKLATWYWIWTKKGI